MPLEVTLAIHLVSEIFYVETDDELVAFRDLKDGRVELFPSLGGNCA